MIADNSHQGENTRMGLTRDDIFNLAMRDAETESLESLEAAADIHDRLVAQQKDLNRKAQDPQIQNDKVQVTSLDHQ